MTAARWPALTNSFARLMPLWPPRDRGGEAYLLINQMDFFTSSTLVEHDLRQVPLCTPLGVADSSARSDLDYGAP